MFICFVVIWIFDLGVDKVGWDLDKDLDECNFFLGL